MKVHEIDFAREFAIRAHGAQMYGDKPYILHLEQVASITQSAANARKEGHAAEHRYRLIVISYLHDILEDTSIDRRALRAIFGEEIAHVVWVMTDPPNKSRHERKRQVNTALTYITEGHLRDALIVKPADRLANMENAKLTRVDLLRMYQGEYPEFRKSAYREGLCDGIWEKLDALAE